MARCMVLSSFHGKSRGGLEATVPEEKDRSGALTSVAVGRLLRDCAVCSVVSYYAKFALSVLLPFTE